MPSLAAVISDTAVPTKASVIATFSAPKKYGSERGRPTLSSRSRRVAPSTRSTSCNSGSSVARPVATLTMIGKKLIRNAVRMAGTAPMPNQTTKMGTSAALGSALQAVITGRSAAKPKRRPPDPKPQQHPDDDGQDKPGQRDPQGAPGMARDPAAKLGQLRGNGPGAGEDEFGDLEHRADDLPQHGGAKQQEPRRPTFQGFAVHGQGPHCGIGGAGCIGAPVWRSAPIWPRKSCTMLLNSRV